MIFIEPADNNFTYRTIIDYYESIIRRIEILELCIKDYKGISADDLIEALNFARPQGERVQSCKLADKTANIALSYEEQAELLNNERLQSYITEYEELKREIEFFKNAVSVISERSSSVLRDWIIKRTPLPKVAEKHGVTIPTMRRWRNNAIAELNGVYAIRLCKNIDTAAL